MTLILGEFEPKMSAETILMVLADFALADGSISQDAYDRIQKYWDKREAELEADWDN